MEKYLIWRFIKNNNKRYWDYCLHWIKNLNEEQLAYFKLERERLTLMGIYKE